MRLSIPTPYTSRRKWLIFTLLGAALAFGIFLRTASSGNFLNPEGGFFFYSVDAYEHLRRVTLDVRSFPFVASFDSYAGFPVGTGQIWPPLFDYILSAVAVLFGGSKATIESVCFMANPFFAALTIVLVFFVARKAFSSEVAGLAAALVIAGNPGHVSYSLPMNFDHHVLEPIAVLLLFSIPFFEKDRRLTVRGKLSAAFLLVITILIWRGTTVYWGAVFLIASTRSFIFQDRRLAVDYASVFALAALAVSLFCIVDPWSTASSVSFGIISWFHVIVLMLFSLALFMLGFVHGRRSFILAASGLLALLGGSLLFPGGRDFFSGILQGVSFLRGSGDPWLESNRELHGVFSKYGFFYSASYLTAAWFAAPLGAALAFKNWRKEGGANPFLLSMVIWSPLILLGLIIRYTPIAAVLSSLSVGYLVGHLTDRLSGNRKPLFLAFCCVLFFLPSLQHYKVSVTGKLPPAVRHGLQGNGGVLNWIRLNTPPTAPKKPEYGILANWDLGSKITYIAQRPALATPFGWETHGYYEEAEFMISTYPEKAYNIARANQIRFVLLRAFEPLKIDYAAALEGEKKIGLRYGSPAEYNPPSSVYARLFYGDGAACEVQGIQSPALGNYRLVFETDFMVETANGFPSSYFKLFEVVPGAIVKGKARPAATVEISIPLTTSRNRLFLFRDRTVADASGNFFFRVPYSTDKKQGDTLALDKYSISGDGIKISKFEVPEAKITREGFVFIK